MCHDPFHFLLIIFYFHLDRHEHIHSSKYSALDCQFFQHTDMTYIYTDGSGIEGYIGATAVILTNHKTYISLKYHLGPDTTHTVYVGKATALLLTLQLIKIYKIHDNIQILADNQAVILS